MLDYTKMLTEVKTKQWGNSIGVVIPKKLVDNLKIKADENIIIDVEKKENPLKEVGRLHEPLFSPTEEWETQGLVSNVVFPTSTALFGDTLYIYYGAADKRICTASVSLSELLSEMQDPTKKHTYGT